MAPYVKSALSRTSVFSVTRSVLISKVPLGLRAFPLAWRTIYFRAAFMNGLFGLCCRGVVAGCDPDRAYSLSTSTHIR